MESHVPAYCGSRCDVRHQSHNNDAATRPTKAAHDLPLLTTVNFIVMKKKQFFIYFFHCIYTKIFWVDVENFVTRKVNTAVKLGGSDIMIYVNDYGIEKDKAYIIQLLVIMGKFHIHKMKWSGGKPIFFFFTNLNNTVIRFINVKQKSFLDF